MISSLSRFIYNKLLNLLLLVLDLLFILLSSSKNQKKGLLLIRLDAIGDFIIWLDSAKEYRTLYPEEKITLISNNIWLALAKEFYYWDEVIGLDREKFFGNLFYRYTMLARIRNAGYKIAISTAYSRELHYGDALIHTCGSIERIGHQGDLSNMSEWGKRISDRWYTRLVPSSSSPIFESIRNAEFIRALGNKDFQCSIANITVNSSDNETLRALPDKYIVLFPGAGAPYRQWETDKFALVADMIYEEFNLPGVICGSLQDKGLSDIIITKSKASLIDIAGMSSLSDLIHVIRNADLVIGNETSAIHIAPSVNTPSVCILGGGNFGRFMPYKIESGSNLCLPTPVFHKMDCFGCRWRKPCMSRFDKRSVVPCISKITVNSVWEQTRVILTDKHKHTITSSENH